MDIVLTLHADHEFNASTFAARVAVATMADLHSAIVSRHRHPQGPSATAARTTTSSPLLHQIEDPARPRPSSRRWIGGPRRHVVSVSEATRLTRMPGFGHRVYKVDDAHARVLRGMARGDRPRLSGRERLFEVAPGASTEPCARGPPSPSAWTSFSRRRLRRLDNLHGSRTIPFSPSADRPAGRATRAANSTRTTRLIDDR